jgi:hypothetical protein
MPNERDHVYERKPTVHENDSQRYSMADRP